MPATPTLDDLLRSVRAESDDPLRQLEAASVLAADLDDLGDALLNHFVDQCRRSGRSWAQIGQHLGVTRQAAQQRFVPSPTPALLDRFTGRARAAVERSPDVARDLGHGYVGTEHLLLALFDDEDALARRVLDRLGVARSAVEDLLVAKVGPLGGPAVTGHVSFTPRAATVLAETVKTAIELGHNYVGTEHLLLALHRGQDGLAKQFLEQLGATHERTRGLVVELLSGYRTGNGS